jgi:hypothetical protein
MVQPMILPLICLLAGLVLGQRFKALLLVPTTALLLALITAGGLLRGDAFWPIASIALLTAASLQIGYLLGLGIRYALNDDRARSSHANPLTKSAPTRRPAHY